MSWSQDQRRLLQALGHELWVHGTRWPAAPSAGSVARAASGANPARGAPEPRPQAPIAPAPSAPPGSPARLLEALRRAAGGADVSALVEDLERLRREPALKRALWPRLRGMRRSHR